MQKKSRSLNSFIPWPQCPNWLLLLKVGHQKRLRKIISKAARLWWTAAFVKDPAGSIRCWNSANMTYWWCSAFITRFLSATAFSDLSIHTRPRRSLKSLWKSWKRCIFDYWRFGVFQIIKAEETFSLFLPHSVTVLVWRRDEFFFLVSWENNHWLASVL